MGEKEATTNSAERDLTRKLTAIFSADVKGYSRLMGDDETATVRTITAYREVMTTFIEQYHGRVVDSPGDNLLAEFASVVDAVQGALAIQHELTKRNAELPDHRQMQFRIGINVGDVITEDGRLYGDGVNIAARIEGLADPGGICLSEAAYTQIENKLALQYEDYGTHAVKNITKPVRVYKVVMDSEAAASPPSLEQAALQPAKQPVSSRRWLVPSLAIVAILAVGTSLWIGRNFFSPSVPPREPIPAEGPSALPLPPKPSIAVLPFTNMSDDPEQEYFSDGITDTLITDLSQIPELFVIARNSTFTYKGEAVKVREVGRELGVRYVLEGSVQKASDQVRINVQLIEATTGHHMWAERYDRPLSDIFALQDEITRKIVEVLQIKVMLWEQGLAAPRFTANPEAYDCFLRGMASYWSLTKAGNADAQRMFTRAIDLDPHYATAYAGSAMTYVMQWNRQWSHDPQALEKAFELAQKAVTLDESQAAAHNVLGWIYLAQKQHDKAITGFERAIVLQPNAAGPQAMLGQALNLAGRPEEGIVFVRRAMRLNPRYPFIYLYYLGFAYFLMEQHEAAITAFKQALTRNSELVWAYSDLAVIYSELGKVEEAQAAAAEVRRLIPNFSLKSFVQRMSLKDPMHRERMIAGLRKAGLE